MKRPVRVGIVLGSDSDLEVMLEAVKVLDALLSMAQMPQGVPVATVAIGKWGAANAGILAAQILAQGDPALGKRLDAYRRGLADEVDEGARRVAEQTKRPTPRT